MAKNILIVDDSALMRRVLSDIIKKDSRFHVESIARNGETALAEIRENPNRFDVILLDFFYYIRKHSSHKCRIIYN